MSVPAGSASWRWNRWSKSVILTLLLLLSSCAMASGQVSPPSQPPAQSPLQRVRMARLTYLAGQVQLDGAAGAGSQSAVLNMPILEGTVLSTANDGQAELEFEDGSLVRLTPNSALSVVKLSVDADGDFQSKLALLHGLAYLELRSTAKYQYSLDAQGDTLSPLENSTLRVSLDQPPAIIAVLQGKVHVSSIAPAAGQAGAQADATAGQTLRSDSTPGQQATGTYLVKDGIDPDSWDQWNRDRDVVAAKESTNQTTARNGFAGDQGYGWSDLDANGSWYDLPGQGQVWQPDVAADAGIDAFDPYGYGAWAWTPGYGYAWASGYSWGWTPYRCGNWQFWDGFGWGWAPGPFCGVYGFGGYGFRLHLHRLPPIYHGPRRPFPRSGSMHPNIPVHGGVAPLSPRAHLYSSRTINGQLVEPLRPVGRDRALGDARAAGGATVLGAALSRDFPVDPTTHHPVLGVASNHPMPSGGAVGGGVRATWRPAGIPSSGFRSGTAGARPVYVSPLSPMSPTNPNRSAPPPGIRPQPYAPSVGVPRNSPSPMQPYTAPVMPRYTPPPPPMPHYTPPPMPRYSPPPSYAPPPAPRFSPPPPPPAAAPHGR
jgi:FecR protein